jgi:hypothetical protein
MSHEGILTQMRAFLRRWRGRRRRRRLAEREEKRRVKDWDQVLDAQLQGGVVGSGRRTAYDEDRTHDEWS